MLFPEKEKTDVLPGLDSLRIDRKWEFDASFLTEICSTLGICFSRSDIQEWFADLSSDTYTKKYSRLEKEYSDPFLLEAINIVIYCNYIEKFTEANAAALKEDLINYLYDLIGDVERRECVLSYSTSNSDPFESRRTPMTTSADRSASLDRPILRYLAEYRGTEVPIILDIGVGFPPITTVNTATLVSDKARVVGVDVIMPDLMVKLTDEENPRECDLVFFELNKSEKKFSPIVVFSQEESWGLTKYSKIDGLHKEFILRKAESARQALMQAKGESLYLDMLSIDFNRFWRLAPEHRERITQFYDEAATENNGCCLLLQPVRSYAASNLEFRKDDFRLNSIEKADVIRLANVFHKGYYTLEESRQAIRIASDKLNDGGILIVATNDEHSLVFRKQGQDLLPERCTIMLRNQTSIVSPWDFFPEFKVLFDSIFRNTSGLEYQRQDTGFNAMSPRLALALKDRLASDGFNSQLFFDDNTWCEIELGTLAKGLFS